MYLTYSLLQDDAYVSEGTEVKKKKKKKVLKVLDE